MAGIILVCGMAGIGFGQTAKAPADYSQRLIDAKNDTEAFEVLREAKNDYFVRQDYAGFVEYLKAAGQKNKRLAAFIQYFTALTRYSQLKFLEAQQDWNEYFSRGEEYREEIGTNLQKSVGATTVKQPLHIAARLLLWQFHKDQESGLDEQFLGQLVGAVGEYAKTATDPQPIKEAADTLMLYGLKPQARELYRLFGEKIFSSTLSNDELQNTAMSFYKEGNIDLAEAVFNVYIERTLNVSSKDKLKLELADIARMFSYNSAKPYDLDFAEKIFVKMEVILGKDALDESLLYMRGFNLEKAREWSKAKQVYDELVSRFPQSRYADQAAFKSAAISVYALRDIGTALAGFDKLAAKAPAGPYGIASVYQLGLLNQWQENGIKAKEYYAVVLSKAGAEYKDIAALAAVRAAEVESNKYMEYNLRTFLDLALKEENAQFTMSRAQIQPAAYRAKVDSPVTVTASATAPESGCMQVQMDYFWTGDVGTEAGASQQPEQTLTFSSPGTKIIGLVVATPAAVVDRAFDFIDVE